MQTLSNKFNGEFDVRKAFYGINSKGQIKVWVDENFMKLYKENPKDCRSNLRIVSDVKTINELIYCICEYFGDCIKVSEKNIFGEMIKKLFK